MIVKDTLHTTLLNRNNVKYAVVIPSSSRKTVYWLHGFEETYEDLLSKPNMIRLAEQYHITIVLPDVPDNYYVNQTNNNCFTEQFIITELMPEMEKRYHISGHKEDTCIAGISMGGFGSLLIGSHYPNLFGKIACISGAFVIDDLLIANQEVNPSYFQSIFGYLPSLEDSPEYNPQLAALHSLKEKQLPPIFMTCGTKDLLYKRNTKLYHHLSDAGADITWFEKDGIHNWKFFNSVLEDTFSWLSK